MEQLNSWARIFSIVFATIWFAGCGPSIGSRFDEYGMPKWTFENPDADKSAPKVAMAPAPTAAGGSLDDLRSGQSSATPASSPLKEIYFGFDSSALSAEARKILTSNADWLKANPAARAQIEGHCDQRGTVEYNLALGSRRAQTALDFLVTLGIAKDRLSTISYGQEIPVCTEKNEACWGKNRRARFVIATSKSVS